MAKKRKLKKRLGKFRHLVKKAEILAENGMLLEAFAVYEKVLAVNPRDVELLEATGDFARQWNMLKEGEAFYCAALEVSPLNLDLMNKRALCLHHMGKFDEAMEVFRNAIEFSGSGTPELWGNLGITCAEAGDTDNALIFLEEAVSMDPRHPASLANIGELYSRLGETKKAQKYLKRAMEVLPDDVNSRFNFAMAVLKSGDLKRGWSLYEARLDARVATAAIYTHGLKRWAGQPVGEGELLICQEQGLGDQIMFMSMISDIEKIAPKPVLETIDRLESLVGRSFPDVTIGKHVKETVMKKGIYRYEWLDDLEVKPKYWVPMGSLGRYVRASLEDFPNYNEFIKPCPEKVAHWRKWLDSLPKGRKVGLCWRSTNLSAKRLKNYMSLETYGEILKAEDMVWINLQYDECSEELAKIRELHGVEVHVPPDLDQFNDFENVAALIKALDMVVSAPTVVRALAGAMAVPTMLIVPTRIWTSFGHDGRECFYPSVNMIHPDKWGDWEESAGKALAAICEDTKLVA